MLSGSGNKLDGTSWACTQPRAFWRRFVSCNATEAQYGYAPASNPFGRAKVDHQTGTGQGYPPSYVPRQTLGVPSLLTYGSESKRCDRDKEYVELAKLDSTNSPPGVGEP